MKKLIVLIWILNYTIINIHAQSVTPVKDAFFLEHNTRWPLIIERDSFQLIGDYTASLNFWREKIGYVAFYQKAVNFAKMQNQDSAFYFLNQYINLQIDNRSVLVDEAFDNLRKEKLEWKKIQDQIEQIHLKNNAIPISNKELALKLFHLNICYYKYSFIPIISIPDSCVESFNKDCPEKNKKTVSGKAFMENKEFCDGIFRNLLIEYGYPTIENSGSFGAETALLLLNSLGISDTYYKLIKEKYEAGSYDSISFAIITDKYFQQKGNKQYYGTQTKMVKNDEGNIYQRGIYPIKKAASVNERRKQMGFKETIEEYQERIRMTANIYIE
jgi:hypothetical protein